MSSAVPSPKDIIKSFPDVPQKIQGLPRYTDLKQLRETVKNNAASVDTIYGGGRHGHLGLVVPANVYNMIVPPLDPDGNAWVDPVHPGLVPAYPPNANDDVIETIRAAHKEQLRCWKLCGNVNKALVQQILQSVDNIYIRALRNRHTGYANLHVRDLLQYLFKNYGRILPHAVAENDQLFRKSWDPSAPFEVLIDQIETAQEVAEDAVQPYTRAQILNNAFHIVQQTGVFIDDCKRWTEKPDGEKTWINFKTHFLAAQEQFRLQQTTKHSGFFSYLIEKTVNDKCTPILDAANSILTATTASDDDPSTLTNTHTAYTTQHHELKTIIDNLRKEVAQLKEQATKKKTRTPRKDRGGYCWSHGYLVHPDHTSITCRSKKPGHQDDATWEDNKGGSQWGKPNNM